MLPQAAPVREALGALKRRLAAFANCKVVKPAADG
jgi:hypothetical protein